MAADPNMPSLVSMPNEVLLTLFEKLETKDLCHLMNVNHRFQNLIKAHESAWTKLFMTVDYNKMSLYYIETRLKEATSFGSLTVANMTNGSHVQSLITNISEHKSKIHTIILSNCIFQLTELNDLLLPFTGIKSIIFNATMIHPYVPVENGNALIVPAFKNLKFLKFKNYHDDTQLSFPHVIFEAVTRLEDIETVRMKNFQLVAQQQNLKRLVTIWSVVPNNFWNPAIQNAINFQLILFYYTGIIIGGRLLEPELIDFLRSQRALRDLSLCSCGIEEINAVLSHTYLTSFAAVLVARPTFCEISGINQSVKNLNILFFDPAVLNTIDVMVNAFRGVTTMSLDFGCMVTRIPEDYQIIRFHELKNLENFTLNEIPTSILKIIEVEMLTMVHIVPSNTYQDQKDIQNFIKYHKKVQNVKLDVQLEETDFQLMLQEWLLLKQLSISCSVGPDLSSAFNFGYIERLAKITLEHGASLELLEIRSIPLYYQKMVTDLFQYDPQDTSKPRTVVQLKI